MNVVNTEICSSPVMFSLQLRHHNVDISVAVSTDSGLITPIVFDAAQKVTDFLSIRHNFFMFSYTWILTHLCLLTGCDTHLYSVTVRV